jgi:cell division protein FtsB
METGYARRNLKPLVLPQRQNTFPAAHAASGEPKENNMKLKYKIETLEEVPEAQRGFYVEAGNAFVLDCEDAAHRDDVTHLQNRLTHAETEITTNKEDSAKSLNQLAQEKQALEKRIAELETNRGTGANGTLGNPPANELNPFKKETLNLTKQSELVKKDPAKAQKLRQAAQA